MTIRCLLWDFGDTLCDERFIWDSGPRWREAYRALDQGAGLAWNLGEIDTAEFSASLAPHLELEPAAVQAHMIDCCSRIHYFPRTYTYFQSRALSQAIVTVNPDLFSTTIVPHDRLDQHCEAIVTSWEEASVDKGRLCELALERLPVKCLPSEALLIDNKQENLEAWESRGGRGYLYSSDEQFGAAIAAGWDSLLS